MYFEPVTDPNVQLLRFECELEVMIAGAFVRRPVKINDIRLAFFR
jgi:hypothetical protein